VQIELLIESLNPKGIRERRLLESLRKVKDILRLKKSMKATAKPEPVTSLTVNDKTDSEANN